MPHRDPDRLSQIERITAELVGRSGYYATSLQSIADRVGITKAGLLHYVGSKDNLLTMVMRDYDVEGMAATGFVEDDDTAATSDDAADETVPATTTTTETVTETTSTTKPETATETTTETDSDTEEKGIKSDVPSQSASAQSVSGQSVSSQHQASQSTFVQTTSSQPVPGQSPMAQSVQAESEQTQSAQPQSDQPQSEQSWSEQTPTTSPQTKSAQPTSPQPEKPQSASSQSEQPRSTSPQNALPSQNTTSSQNGTSPQDALPSQDASSSQDGSSRSTHQKTETRSVPLYFRRLAETNAQRPEFVRLFTMLNTETLNPDHPAREYFQEREKMLERVAHSSQWSIPEGVDGPSAIMAAFMAMDGIQIKWLREPGRDLVAMWRQIEPALFPPSIWGEINEEASR